MDTDKIIYLNVKKVPAFDTEKMMYHTAYTVFSTDGNALSGASGWTLKDAINFYRKQYGIGNQITIRLRRPFRSQQLF